MLDDPSAHHPQAVGVIDGLSGFGRVLDRGQREDVGPQPRDRLESVVTTQRRVHQHQAGHHGERADEQHQRRGDNMAPTSHALLVGAVEIAPI
jgi:hypothetical protein